MQRIHPTTQKTYSYVRWQSNADRELGQWREHFYPQSNIGNAGKKQIPADLATYLDPLVLAVWHMDDGHYSVAQKHSFIYLGRVSRREADIAAEAIRHSCRVSPRVYDKKKKGFALFFSVAETQLLHSVIRPHMHKDLFYKLFVTP